MTNRVPALNPPQYNPRATIITSASKKLPLINPHFINITVLTVKQTLPLGDPQIITIPGDLVRPSGNKEAQLIS